MNNQQEMFIYVILTNNNPFKINMIQHTAKITRMK